MTDHRESIRAALHARMPTQPHPLLVTHSEVLPAATAWVTLRRWVRSFREAGLRTGDVVVIRQAPSAQSLVAFLACLWEGLNVHWLCDAALPQEVRATLPDSPEDPIAVHDTAPQPWLGAWIGGCSRDDHLDAATLAEALAPREKWRVVEGRRTWLPTRWCTRAALASSVLPAYAHGAELFLGTGFPFATADCDFVIGVGDGSPVPHASFEQAPAP